jgi:hypothetical protein
MDFGKVLSRAWHIVWNNKVLWIFGILASCGSRSGGSGGGGNFGGSAQGNFNDTGNLPPQFERFFANIERFFERIPQDRIVLYVLIFVFVILLIALITWLVGLYGRAAVIRGTLQADAGQKLSFGQLWRDAWAPYGRVVGLNSLLALISFLAALIIVLPMILIGVVTAGIGFLCLLPLFCLLIPLALAYSVYSEIANVALVKEGLGATDALERAWQVLRNNLGNLALMAIILIIGGFVVNIIIAIPLFVAIAPLVAGMFSGTQSGFGQGLNVFLICLVVYLPVLIVLNGIVQSYLHAAWTLAYGEIAGGAALAVRKPAAPRKTVAKKATRKK